MAAKRSTRDFRQTVYVDRCRRPARTIRASPGIRTTRQNRDFYVKNPDLTANSVHFFLNLGPNLTDAQILAMVNGGTQGSQLDRDTWKYGFSNVLSGNNVAHNSHLRNHW